MTVIMLILLTVDGVSIVTNTLSINRLIQILEKYGENLLLKGNMCPY